MRFVVVHMSLTLALASGCALAHERVSSPGIVPADASLSPHDATAIPPDGTTTPPDVGTRPPDVGPLPPDGGPPSCPVQRADATCLESFLISPGRPFALPYDFDACGCCLQTECSVEVSPSTHTIAIGTTLCPDLCDCDACNPAHGSCEVPALSEGLWLVVANGLPAFELPVFPDSAEVPPPPGCASYAHADRCAPATPIPGRPVSGNVCVAPRARTSAIDVLRVVDPCGGCGDIPGTCYAALTPRLTDDFPPGGDLHLQVNEYGTACDVDCPDVCVRVERECVVPALVRGDTYRVYLGERLVRTFVAGDPSTDCDVVSP